MVLQSWRDAVRRRKSSRCLSDWPVKDPGVLGFYGRGRGGGGTRRPRMQDAERGKESDLQGTVLSKLVGQVACKETMYVCK